ncbi:MAG: N-acetylmuramoyl-L-alanine amidase [Calditrichaeota bacterium]|nr:N-acetylmuramoyl-L-alanine amidase [Calditrichota bacterium]
MKFVLNRKIVVSREEVRQSVGKAPADQKPEDQVAVVPATPAPPAPAIVPVQSRILEVFGFEYDGGYRPDRLEYTHLRKRPIDMIIYHHTAMHSNAPYEAIVQEFERRGWLTGYHSVVFANGQVRTICRWDRIGNHTRGYNARSLGLAFHGNFEPDPSVPYSNPDGRYGILFPTPLQVDRGARLVALWILLYNIAVDFDQAIVPHNKLAPKACPGSNFPHQAFHEKINHYLNLWKSDPDMQAVIQEFSNYPMVKA